MKTHTRVFWSLISLLSASVMCGCDSTTMATSPAEQKQATQRSISQAQNESAMPPEAKTSIMRQMQSEAARHQSAK